MNFQSGGHMKLQHAKSGVAFGGGGTRGFAHIGVIRVFQENHIEFDYVAGNSAGAIAGALYAAGIPWQELYDFALNIREKNVLPKRPIFSYMSSEVIEQFADCFLKGAAFSELKKPFCAVAVNLENGMLETLCRGSVSKALSASCAVPGVFQPVRIGRKTYIDGGTLRSIPTEAVRAMGAEAVVGINLNADRNRGTQSVKRLDVFLTAYNLSINVNSEICAQYADIMLRPQLDSYRRHQIRSIESMLKIGEDEARAHIEAINALLRRPDEALA
jgi:Predicted esterase of the alpha-beta hydrolase superfamily